MVNYINYELWRPEFIEPCPVFLDVDPKSAEHSQFSKRPC